MTIKELQKVLDEVVANGKGDTEVKGYIKSDTFFVEVIWSDDDDCLYVVEK